MSTDDDRGEGIDEGRALVAEYALGLLDAAEHGPAARRIAADPVLAAELRLWRRRLAALDHQFAEEAAPAGMFARIERRLFGAPAPRGLSAVWGSLALWRAAAAGSLAVAAIAIGISLVEPRVDPADSAARLVAAIEALEGSGVSFVALYDPEKDMVRITAVSGAPMPQNDYELWAIEGNAAPVSMGVVSASARMEKKMPGDMQIGEGTVLAISIEPKGGSPTGAPTGPVVAMGKAIAI